MEQKKCEGRSEDVAQVKSNAATEHRWEWMNSNLEPGKAEYKCAQCGMRMWLACTEDLNQLEWATRNTGVCQGKNPAAEAYTLHGKPLAVGTRLSAPESWGKDRVYLVTELKMDDGPVAIVKCYPYPGYMYWARLDPGASSLWGVIPPKLNGEEIKVGDQVIHKKGGVTKVTKLEWLSLGWLDITVEPICLSAPWKAVVSFTAAADQEGTHPHWHKWSPKVAGEPIAVGDWVTYSYERLVGCVRTIFPDGNPTQFSIEVDLRPGGRKCSVMTTGYSTPETQDNCPRMRKLHPQGKDVNPVIGDIVKHPTQDAIGKIVSIYGLSYKYVKVKWLSPADRVGDITDYNWDVMRSAEKPLVLLREKTDGILSYLAEGNVGEKAPKQMAAGKEPERYPLKHSCQYGLSLDPLDLQDAALLAELKAEGWKEEPTQRKTLRERLEDIGAPESLTNKLPKHPGPKSVKIDEIQVSRDKEGSVFVELLVHASPSSGFTTKFEVKASSIKGALWHLLDTVPGVESEVDDKEQADQQALDPDGYVRQEDVAKLGAVLKESEQELLFGPDSLAWKPFPQYLPDKKGKYLVHFVEFGDCKVIRWKGTRWAKYNDSVSSFYSIPIEEIVPFTGAISAPALTEQQLNELDPPEFKVGDTVYDPVAFPGKTGEVVEVTPWGLFPVRVQFGPKSTAVYTNNGRYKLNYLRRLTHIPYKPGYIIT